MGAPPGPPKKLGANPFEKAEEPVKAPAPTGPPPIKKLTGNPFEKNLQEQKTASEAPKKAPMGAPPKKLNADSVFPKRDEDDLVKPAPKPDPRQLIKGYESPPRKASSSDEEEDKPKTDWLKNNSISKSALVAPPVKKLGGNPFANAEQDKAQQKPTPVAKDDSAADTGGNDFKKSLEAMLSRGPGMMGMQRPA